MINQWATVGRNPDGHHFIISYDKRDDALAYKFFMENKGCEVCIMTAEEIWRTVG